MCVCVFRETPYLIESKYILTSNASKTHLNTQPHPSPPASFLPPLRQLLLPAGPLFTRKTNRTESVSPSLIYTGWRAGIRRPRTYMGERM